MQLYGPSGGEPFAGRTVEADPADELALADPMLALVELPVGIDAPDALMPVEDRLVPAADPDVEPFELGDAGRIHIGGSVQIKNSEPSSPRTVCPPFFLRAVTFPRDHSPLLGSVLIEAWTSTTSPTL